LKADGWMRTLKLAYGQILGGRFVPTRLLHRFWTFQPPSLGKENRCPHIVAHGKHLHFRPSPIVAADGRSFGCVFQYVEILLSKLEVGARSVSHPTRNTLCVQLQPIRAIVVKIAVEERNRRRPYEPPVKRPIGFVFFVADYAFESSQIV